MHTDVPPHDSVVQVYAYFCMTGKCFTYSE